MSYKANLMDVFVKAKLIMSRKHIVDMYLTNTGLVTGYYTENNYNMRNNYSSDLQDYRSLMPVYNNQSDKFDVQEFNKKFTSVGGFAVNNKIFGVSELWDRNSSMDFLYLDYFFSDKYTIAMSRIAIDSQSDRSLYKKSYFYPYTQKRHIYYALVMIDNKTGRLLASRRLPIMFNMSKTGKDRRIPLHYEYPFIVFNSYSKVMYTVIPLQNGKKRIEVDFLKDNGMEQHTFDVDAVYVDRFNLTSPRVYGILWNKEQVEVVGTIGQSIVKHKTTIKEERSNTGYIKNFSVDVFTKKNFLVRATISYVNNSKNSVKITIASRGLEKDKGFSLTDNIYYLKGENCYTLVDNNSNVISTFKSAFDLNKIGVVLDSTLLTRKTTIESDIDSSHYYSGRGKFYDAVVVKGKSGNFAVVEWYGEETEYDDNKGSLVQNAISIYDKHGKLLKQLKGSGKELIVFVKQDFSSNYIYFTKPVEIPFTPGQCFDFSFNLPVSAVNIDSLKTLKFKIDTKEYWGISVQQPIRRFTFYTINKSPVFILTHEDKTVFYAVSRPFEISLVGVVDFKSHRVMSTHRIFPYDVKIQDPLMALRDFNVYSINEAKKIDSDGIEKE